MDSILIKDFLWTGFTGFLGLDLMEWILILYFPGFPEESLELQSPSANTTLIFLRLFLLKKVRRLSGKSKLP